MHPSAFVSGTRVPAIRMLLLLLLNKVHVTVRANRKIGVWSRGLFIAEPSKENNWLMFKNTELLYDFWGEGFWVVFCFFFKYLFICTWLLWVLVIARRVFNFRCSM